MKSLGKNKIKIPQIKLFSNDWFVMLEKQNQRFAELNLASLMQEINLNIKVILTPLCEQEGNEQVTAIADIAQFNDSDINVVEKIAATDNFINFNFAAGYFAKAFDDNAKTTLVLTLDTLIVLAQQQKMSSVLEAFINGYIQVEGDMSQLMALQFTKFSEQQLNLYQAIAARTQLQQAS